MDNPRTLATRYTTTLHTEARAHKTHKEHKKTRNKYTTTHNNESKKRMTSLTNSTSSLFRENLAKEVKKYGEFDIVLFGVSFAFHIKDKSFNKLSIIRPPYGGFETALRKDNKLVYLSELGYEGVSYFETKVEVLTEIIRLGKTLRPPPKYKVADTVLRGPSFCPKDVHVVVDLKYVNGNLGNYTYKLRAEFKGFREHWMSEKDLRSAGGRRLDLVREWQRESSKKREGVQTSQQSHKRPKPTEDAKKEEDEEKRTMTTAPVEVKVGQVWQKGSHQVLVTMVQKVWVDYKYVDPNRAHLEGSYPLYLWHKDCVFVEQREVEEKDEDYIIVSDESDEESTSDEDEEEDMPH